jgi:ubiquinone/menaquinone biosynthesis C-methylase UbiE
MIGDSDLCPASYAGFLDNPIRRLLHSPVRIVGPYISPGDMVLDVGPGSGFFTRPMARIVGDGGCVVAADLQEEMLAMLLKRAEQEGLVSRIRTHRTSLHSLDLEGYGPFDFVLAFYVVHELPDAESFFIEVASVLRPGGRMLVVEPKLHVTEESFAETVKAAKAAGFSTEKPPGVLFSRTALLSKA